MSVEYGLVIVGLGHLVFASLCALAATYTRPRTPGRQLGSILALALATTAAVDLMAAAQHLSRTAAVILITTQMLIGTAAFLVLRRQSSVRSAFVRTALTMRLELEHAASAADRYTESAAKTVSNDTRMTRVTD